MQTTWGGQFGKDEDLCFYAKLNITTPLTP